MQSYKKVKGSALLSALFIMTLVAIVATAMSLRLQLDIYRTQNLLKSNNLYLSSQYVVFWAMDFLENESKQKIKKNETGLIAQLPANYKSDYANIQISGEIYDLQAKFNINNLQDPRFYPVFIRLIKNTQPEKNIQNFKSIVKPIAFWIRAFSNEHNDDEYLSWYLKQKPPYYPAYQALQSISELNLIYGIDKKIYNNLSSYIMAVPDIAPLNVYTVPEFLLKTLSHNLKEEQLKAIFKERAKNSPNNTKMYQLLEKLDVHMALISFESKYFLSVSSAIEHDLTMKIYTVIKKEKDKNGKIQVSIIKQTININE